MTHLTGDYWGVEVPESADMSYGFAFDSSVPFWIRYYPKNKRDIHDSRIIELSPGQWEIVALAKDITQAEWKKIVEPKLFNAIAAAGFMLAAHGLGFSTTLIIKKIA